MRSLLSSAAHQLEDLAESLENSCEDFEGPEDEDPQATEQVADARALAQKIKEHLDG